MNPFSNIKSPHVRESLLTHLPVIGLLTLFVMGNIAFSVFQNEIGYPRNAEEFIVGLGIGMIGAQGGLHSIWTVFGPWHPIWRGLTSLTLAILLFGCLLGPAMREMYFEWKDFWFLLLCLPIYLLAVQAPLWAMKSGLGWQIRRPRKWRGFERANPLSIQGMMIATAAVAVAITCLRAARPLTHQSLLEFFTAIAISTSITTIVSLLTTLPTLGVILYPRRLTLMFLPPAALDVLVWLGLIGVISIFEGPPPADAWWMLSGILVGFVAVLNIPLLIARRLGYRMARGQKATQKTNT